MLNYNQGRKRPKTRIKITTNDRQTYYEPQYKAGFRGWIDLDEMVMEPSMEFIRIKQQLRGIARAEAIIDLFLSPGPSQTKEHFMLNHNQGRKRPKTRIKITTNDRQTYYEPQYKAGLRGWIDLDEMVMEPSMEFIRIKQQLRGIARAEAIIDLFLSPYLSQDKSQSIWSTLTRFIR